MQALSRCAVASCLVLALSNDARAEYVVQSPAPYVAQYPVEPEWTWSLSASTGVIDWLQYANAACGASQGKLLKVTVEWSGACSSGRLEGPGTLNINGNRILRFVGSFSNGLAKGHARLDF